MTAIYQEIVLAWGDEEFKVQPSYRMVQEIEASGISIMGVCQRIERGEPPTSQVAEIISHMLKSGGARGVTPAAVYEHLAAKASIEEWSRIYTAILMGFIPQEPDPGKLGGPEDGADTNGATTENPPTT